MLMRALRRPLHLIRGLEMSRCFIPVAPLTIDDLDVHPITNRPQARPVVVTQDGEAAVYVYCKVFGLGGVELDTHDNAS